jgi:hypothetical protein
MAANRKVVQRRIFAKGFTGNFSPLSRFLQINDSEAQAEIFYGPFYGRARF